MLPRLRSWIWQFLIALDQLAHVWLVGWLYVWRGGDCPSADETISSKVGRRAAEGRPWALVLERLINRLAEAFGDAPDHCRRSIEYDEF